MLTIRRVDQDLYKKQRQRRNYAAAVVYINYSAVCQLMEGQEYRINLRPGRYIIESEINKMPTKTLDIFVTEKDMTVELGISNTGYDNSVGKTGILFYKPDAYIKIAEE